MSSGSKWIPGTRKARAWKKRVKTMMTELNLFKEFAISSTDELRDEKSERRVSIRLYTHTFNSSLCGTTWVSRYQKGKTNLDHMQVCTSLQTDNHASTPPLKIFKGRMPFLPPNQQRQQWRIQGVSRVSRHPPFCLGALFWKEHNFKNMSLRFLAEQGAS